MSDHFCPLYNQGLYVEKISKTHCHIGMCCFQDLSKDSYKSLNFGTNEYLEKVRNTAQAGNAPSECSNCWNMEKLGFQSQRQAEIMQNDTHGFPYYDSPVLTNLFYNSENVCNLKCITCGPQFSSKWNSDYNKLGYPRRVIEQKKQTKKNVIYQDLDFKNLRTIHFTGGEPLLTQDHKDIMKNALEHNSLPNCVISYNTNGTVIPDSETVELWKQSKLVKLYFSIDSVEESFNYIRHPADWLEVKNNLTDTFYNMDLNIIFGVGITASIANVFYLGQLLTWIDQYFPANREGDKTSVYINTAGDLGHGGKSLALENMNPVLADSAVDYLTDVITKIPHRSNILFPVIQKIQKTITYNDEWIEYLNRLDQIRNTSWKNSLSELYSNINK